MDNQYVIIGLITMLSYWQYFGGMYGTYINEPNICTVYNHV